ncbi:MAG: homoaconitase [Phycisphaerales bacterium]|nr:homoaconitase [Phycisphaerales bacterium]
MTQTAIEKIVERHAVGLGPGGRVRAGDYVTLRPKHLMTHDNTGAVIGKFLSIAGEHGKILNAEQPVFAIDHDIQNTSAENLGKYAKIERFAAKHGVDYYPPGRGIAHQVMIEEGYVTPGSLCVGSDSHSNIYGAIAACGTPVVRTDAAAIWATGETWWQVPDQVRVILTGRMPEGTTGKDVIITLCGHFNNDEVLNCCVEFAGDGVAGLSVEDRLTISNMTTEWGALTGFFPFDETLRDWLLDRADVFSTREPSSTGRVPYIRNDIEHLWLNRHDINSDEGACFAKTLTLDLFTVSPHVSGPNSVKVMRPVAEMRDERVTINKAYLMSCVNGRLGDFEAAARIFTADDGSTRRVADGVGFYIAAASSVVQQQSQAKGYWGRLRNAGAIELPPGCGACIGLGAGTLEPGEVGVSATNRNFQGRMGSRDALCYLASPAVVAESAIRGYIASPGGSDAEVRGTIEVHETPGRGAGEQSILGGFPDRITGRALYLPLDNLNTDGIYGKDVTYRDDITFAQQGRYAMLNYDPAFQEIAAGGDIIVGGRNFGSGSSREQAATALASKGIRLVIAATAGQTYKRNAFNNGFVVIECPGLTDQLAAMFAERANGGTRTIPGPEITVDFKRSAVTCEGKTHSFGALSETAQELVVAGGSESLVSRRLAARSLSD